MSSRLNRGALLTVALMTAAIGVSMPPLPKGRPRKEPDPEKLSKNQVKAARRAARAKKGNRK